MPADSSRVQRYNEVLRIPHEDPFFGMILFDAVRLGAQQTRTAAVG
jgi:hypothetical protein